MTWTRPRLYPLQERAIFAPERYVVIEASTKAGKTLGCLIWLTEQAVQGKPGWNYWWVAPIREQAKIAFKRLKRYLPAGSFVSNDTDLSITLAHGPVIVFKSADNPDSLYGEDVHAAVIDEASRCKAEAWYAVRSTVTATGGSVRIIGNVKGRRNWAYELGQRAKAGEPGMAYFRITAHDAVQAGVLDAAEVADAQRGLPDAVYRELYLAEASDDAGNPFGLAAIRACTQPELASGPPSVWGWDIARSIDWTVGIGLNRAGATCAFERWNMHELPPGIAPGSEYWEATTTRIRDVTGTTPGMVDSTGVGDAVFEAIAKGRENFEGFKFTAPSKQSLMEGLAVAIQQRQISIPAGVITIELEQFEYVYTRTGVQYSAPAGMHDDCVMGLALAVRKRGRPVDVIVNPLMMAGAAGWNAR